MLRIKRSVQTLYNTQVNVNTAQMALGKMEELEKQAAAAAAGSFRLSCTITFPR
jgi:hypothetical protein